MCGADEMREVRGSREDGGSSKPAVVSAALGMKDYKRYRMGESPLGPRLEAVLPLAS